MATQKTKFTVGLFVTFGLGIALLAFIWLGMSRFLEKGQYYATYFDKSVQGLDIDSDVKYRGVTIGRVDSIGVAPDSKLIQVVLKIETGQKLGDDIVAQLSTAGITGAMFVDLDRKEEGDIDQSPELTFPSEYPIVSSKPSATISDLSEGLVDVFSQIKALDLGGISKKVKLTLDNINLAIADADIKGLSTSIAASLDDIRLIVDRERWDNIFASVNDILDNADSSLLHLDNSIASLERITEGKAETVENAIDDLKIAMEKANIFLEKGTSLMEGADDSISTLSSHLLNIARDLEMASENLNRITEIIADQPSQLIFGEPPDPRKVEE
jgi:phospholipid/cholesterol/gamma-HCH transport system substrate-binding protein